MDPVPFPKGFEMKDNITVLGVGNILYSDDGAGIRVVEKLEAEYDFPDDVILVDGGFSVSTFWG